jgi:hypothetical protein
MCSLRDAGKQMECDIHKSELKGKRVRLKSTSDRYSMLGFNDLGTVTDVTKLPDSIGEQLQLRINWDNGTSRPLVYGIDSFNIFMEARI